MEVKIHEAKSSLSKVIKHARADDEVIPVDSPGKRIFGSAKGLITFKKGWDAPMTKRDLDDFLCD